MAVAGGLGIESGFSRPAQAIDRSGLTRAGQVSQVTR